MPETYPWEWYTDPEILVSERERIFRNGLALRRPRREPPEPSSYVACTSGGLPVVVMCDEDGELRAFLNVCRHRGSEVVSGTGRRSTLQCP